MPFTTTKKHLIKETEMRTNKLLFVAWAIAGLVALFIICGLIASVFTPAQVATAPAYMATPTAAGAQPVVVQPAAAPVIVQQHDGGGFFSGFLMGHLMSSHQSVAAPAVVENRTTVIKKTVIVNKGDGSAAASPKPTPAPAPAPTPAAPKPAFTTTQPAKVQPTAAPRPAPSFAPRPMTYRAPTVHISSHR